MALPVSPGTPVHPAAWEELAWSCTHPDWANAVETTIKVASRTATDRLASFFVDCLLVIVKLVR